MIQSHGFDSPFFSVYPTTNIALLVDPLNWYQSGILEHPFHIAIPKHCPTLWQFGIEFGRRGSLCTTNLRLCTPKYGLSLHLIVFPYRLTKSGVKPSMNWIMIKSTPISAFINPFNPTPNPFTLY